MILANPKISGDEKAELIKNHLKENSEWEIQGNLLEELGKNNVVLQCVDADLPEIIIPHNLLNE